MDSLLKLSGKWNNKVPEILYKFIHIYTQRKCFQQNGKFMCCGGFGIMGTFFHLNLEWKYLFIFLRIFQHFSSIYASFSKIKSISRRMKTTYYTFSHFVNLIMRHLKVSQRNTRASQFHILMVWRRSFLQWSRGPLPLHFQRDRNSCLSNSKSLLPSIINFHHHPPFPHIVATLWA